RRVDAAQRAVDVEGRRRRRPLGALGRDALEDVARDDVSLHDWPHLLVALALREAPERACRAARLAVPGDARLETSLDLLGVGCDELRGYRAGVEADERLGDDEPALGESVALLGERHRPLE